MNVRTHGTPRLERAGDHEDACRYHMVEELVAQQPGQVGGRPPVGIVDQDELPDRSSQAHVLAARRGLHRSRAVNGTDDLPPGRRARCGELRSQACLALTARTVQPADRQPVIGLLTPGCQFPVFLVAPGEIDDLEASVQQAAGLLQQPLAALGDR